MLAGTGTADADKIFSCIGQDLQGPVLISLVQQFAAA